VGESLLPLVFVSALTILDWRSLWVIAAAMALLAILPLRLMLRRERVPQGIGGGDQTAGLAHRHWTRAEVIRHPLFWCVAPLILGQTALVTALFFQQVHLTQEKGWTHVEFVALFPVYTATSILALWVAGWLIDRMGTRRLMPVFQIPTMAGFVVMGLAPGLWGGALGMALIALTSGAFGPISTAFWAEYYGTRHLGSIRSLAAAIMVLGSAIGPVATGLLIDAGFSFDRQMPVLALWFAGTAMLVALGLSVAGPPPREIGTPRSESG
jgi:MFS family permease